jgi:hypothetical protein
MSVPGGSRSRVARALALASFLAILGTALVAVTGATRFHIGPVTVSSRNVLRPASAAVLLYLGSLLLAPSTDRAEAWRWLRDRLERWWILAALAAAGTVLWLGLTYGSYAVGGSDSFGYVTQAYLWLQGNLHVSLEPLASKVPWPYPDESLTPLGYRPGVTRHTMVPTYPAGLPLIMAGFVKLFGACGPYFVAPFAGALLVILTYALAVRLSGDRLAAGIAAICMAACPAFLYNLVVPMSDIVTAALWTGALLLLTWPGASVSLAAGVVAGLAVLVRPNLAPLAMAGALAASMWPSRQAPARAVIRTLTFLLPIAAAGVFVGIVNARLYGSPLLSGYGPTSALYAIDHFATNSYLYASWLIESESAVILAALLPFLIPALRPAWFSSRTLLPLGLYVLIIFISYALYLVFNEWWFLRFFLPVFPLLFLCFATPVAWITRRAPALIAIPALVGIMALLASRWTGFAVDRGVLEIGMGEQRTVTVADHITSALPANAIFIALHHAGPIRLYSGRPSVRFDYFAPPRLASAIAWLRDNGYRPYILLENWEEKDFRRRFAGQGPIGELRIPVIAELRDTISVRLYDPLPDRPSYADPIVGPPVARCADSKWGRR